MNILFYSAGYDTGGQAIRFKQAFDKYSEFRFRSCAVRRSYINYPVDAAPSEAQRLAAWADIVHVALRPPGFKDRRGRVNMVGKGKPLVVHYHGTGFRRDPGPRLAELRASGGIGLCSTVDLVLIAPDELEWMPAAYDLDWLAGFRRPQHDGVFRIGHAPTDRNVKSTRALAAAVVRLSKEVSCRLVLIEHQEWGTCLKAKGTVDVYFDQVGLGYGNNATEAWGMGIPVVAGAAEDTLVEMKRRFGQLPFYEATEDTIYESLALLANPLTRQYWAKVGADHAARYHAEAKVVAMLEDVYRRRLDVS